MHEILKQKHTGILIPLFSMFSKNDFGCGDVSSLIEWAEFAKEAGFDIIQILPINEMPPQTNCPYTALTAFAIDPIYISIKDIENISPQILKKIKSSDFLNTIKEFKKKKYIDYDGIKTEKFKILWEQYNYFHKNFILTHSKEAIDFENYCDKNLWWLRDYAIFRRLKDIYSFSTWTQWPDGFKNRQKEVIDSFEKENLFEINFFKYIQWEVDKQFKKAREKLKEYNIKLFGDLPFMVNQESADVWSRQQDFRLDLESGAPPDAFSKEGQRWGIPAPNWQAQVANNFEWWRMKVRKFEEIYDIFRIDHMVGFFRTWVIPHNRSLKPDFDILDPVQQEERGRLFLKTITSSTKMYAIAEDLGVIPDYVRKVLKETKVAGYKIMRWEKNKENFYIHPSDYPAISVATTSTHDTEAMSSWWKNIDKSERTLFYTMLTENKKQEPPKKYIEIKDLVNEALLNSNSIFVIMTISDIIGTNDRINTPGISSKENWSYRIKTEWKKFYQKNERDFEKIKKLVEKRKNEKVNIDN
ncbi:MAG: 4-alpha-glucanotransferase [Elusimicrobiota bacterium]